MPPTRWRKLALVDIILVYILKVGDTLITSFELDTARVLVTNQLLATRFLVPASMHALIPRPRLERLLDKGLQRRLTLVSAPAGFGKTTLLTQWVRALPQELLHDYRVAWLAFDEADICPIEFWTYVLTALERSEPGVVAPLLQWLQTTHEPALELLLTALINALSQTSEHFVLILDDASLLKDPAIPASLAFLIEHQPPQLHLVILTRTDPPVNLPRLRARGQVLEIRTEHLRCTEAEAAAFFRTVFDIDLPADAVREINARAEGWLVGLRLLGLGLQPGNDGRKVHANPQQRLPLSNGTPRSILEYCTEEILFRQPAEVQQFLLRTSILEQLSASLCDEVTEQGNSQQMLAYLERANLFVKPLDEQRRWYRYHQLFAEALRSYLEQEEAGSIPALQQRASQWYEQNGQSDEPTNPSQNLLSPLTKRELEVLHLIAQGASNQEIADRLVLSLQTVKRHVSNTLSKLQASNRTRAVMCARALGLLSDEHPRRKAHAARPKETTVYEYRAV